MGFVDPVRHCQPCAAVTKAEEDFFVTYIKLLFNGNPGYSCSIKPKIRLWFVVGW